LNVFLLIIGLVTLVFGGDFLVKGAVGIAKKFKISTLVIGMTVVSFGTSAPELIVSLKAALNGNPEIAIGNVIGSNIANIALVLAVTIMIFPIAVDRNSKIIDWPMMMLSTGLFYLFAFNNKIEVFEGVIMFVVLVMFIVFLIYNSRKKSKKEIQECESEDLESIQKTRFSMSILYVLAGLVALFFGAEWLLSGAVGLAESLGMEKRVIGITIVAFGTSVPELVTSAVAAYRKQTDISIGNLVGSNIFNIMAVVGITSLVKEIEVKDVALEFDMIWMIGIAVILFPLMLIGKKMGRAKGILLIGAYGTYITLLLLSTTK
jgi:cation:H+ antiporter